MDFLRAKNISHYSSWCPSNHTQEETFDDAKIYGLDMLVGSIIDLSIMYT